MEFYFTPPSTPVKKRLSAHKKTINSHLPHFPSSPSSSSSSFSSSFLPSSNQQGEGLFPGEREGEGLELKYSNSPKKESSARRNSHTDRFIPNRASLDVLQIQK